MSEAFFNHFIDFLFGLAFVGLGVFSTFSFLLLSFLSQNILFSLGFYGVGFATIFYGIKQFRAYHNFRENLYLFFPKLEKNTIKEAFSSNNFINYGENLEISEIVKNDDSTQMKACELYSQGCNYDVIKVKLGLNHPNTAKRLVIKGLKILLKNYGEKQ